MNVPPCPTTQARYAAIFCSSPKRRLGLPGQVLKCHQSVPSGAHDSGGSAGGGSDGSPVCALVAASVTWAVLVGMASRCAQFA